MSSCVKKYEFIWRIENFNSNLPKIGNEIYDSKCLASPSFIFYMNGYTEWYLELYPKTGDNSAFIRCLPICSDYSKDSSINCELYLLAKDFSVHTSKKIKGKCSGIFHCDFSNALEIPRSKLPLQKDLILRCVLIFENKDEEYENVFNDFEELSQDMSFFYAGRLHSDLTLCTGRGDIDKLPVSRTLICIRAPKFAEKLGIQDSDNYSPTVNVSLSLPVLKVLLSYIYTGKISENIDDLLPALYEAASEYQLEDLKLELLPVATHSLAYTKIKASKELFTWDINNFSTLDKAVVKLVDLKPSRFVASFNPVSPEDFQISFKAVAFPEKKHFYLRCKMCVIDKAGGFSMSSDHLHYFESDSITKKLDVASKEKWCFPTLLSKTDLLANKSKFLPNDSLKLRIELEISEGETFGEIFERKNTFTKQFAKIVHLKRLSNDFLDIFKVRNRPLLDGEYYDGDCYNDVILQVGDKGIGCHKAILWARSPIFANMIRQDKKNAINIVVTDTDYETMLLMVQYIYSGQLTNLSAVEITKLYIAAEKYQVSSLMRTCVSFLKKTLSLHNICNILILADQVSNKTLLKSIYEYIKCNKTEVFNSNEWKDLLKNNPTLTSEVVSKTCEERREYYKGLPCRKKFTVGRKGR